MKRVTGVLLLMILLGSCIPNKRYVYMQKNDVRKQDLPLDTTLRSYNVIPYDYKLQPLDILSIRFESLTPGEYDFLSKSPGMTGIVNPAMAYLLGETVNMEGELTFPVIGQVKVQGLNLFELQKKLQSLADEFLESPKVTIRLLNFRITILGEVITEGQVIMSNNRVSILEAIGLAGGLGEFADKSKIKLIRHENGQAKVQYINLLDENFVMSPNYYVHQNDVLVVPPLSQRPFRKYFGPNLALAVSAISILLLGANLLK